MQLHTSSSSHPETTADFPASPPSGRLRNTQFLMWALAIICIANFFNYMDRMLVSALEKQLGDSFKLSDVEFNLLWSLFTVGYMACAIPVGYLADHFNRARLFALCVAIWSAATVATGLADTKLTLYISRVFIGVGEAGCLVIGPALISDYFTRETRGRALSAFYLGQPFGGTAGFALIPIIFHLGRDWPWAFYVAGIPGFLIAVCIGLLPEPPRGVREGLAAHGHGGGSLTQYLQLLRNRSLLLIILAQTFSVLILVPLLHNGKLFLLQKLRSLDPAASAQALEWTATLAMLALMIAGAVGMVVSGLAGDLLARRFQGAYALVAGCGFLLGWPCLLVGFWAEGLAVLLPALAGGCFCMFLCMPAVNTQIANVVHPSQRAAAWALAVFVLHLLGDMVGPLIFGLLETRWGTQQAFEWFSVALLGASLSCFVAAWTAAGDIARHVQGDSVQ